MEYRGKHFIVVRWIEPDTWKWTVYIDEITSKSGEAESLASAVSAVVLLVDKTLSRSFVGPNE
jgi:hypothetical protein